MYIIHLGGQAFINLECIATVRFIPARPDPEHPGVMLSEGIIVKTLAGAEFTFVGLDAKRICELLEALAMPMREA